MSVSTIVCQFVHLCAIGLHACMSRWFAYLYAIVGLQACMSLLVCMLVCCQFAHLHVIVGLYTCMLYLVCTLACYIWSAHLHAIVALHACISFSVHFQSGGVLTLGCVLKPWPFSAVPSFTTFPEDRVVCSSLCDVEMNLYWEGNCPVFIAGCL